jgi:hypothetical protein
LRAEGARQREEDAERQRVQAASASAQLRGEADAARDEAQAARRELQTARDEAERLREQLQRLQADASVSEDRVWCEATSAVDRACVRARRATGRPAPRLSGACDQYRLALCR